MTAAPAAVKVHIPGAFRVHTGGAKTVAVEGTTVDEVLQALIAAHPALKAQLFAPNGELRRFINVFLNDTNVRDLVGMPTVKAGDTLTLIPAISGGCA